MTAHEEMMIERQEHESPAPDTASSDLRALGAWGGSRRDFMRTAIAAGVAIGLPMALQGCVLGAAGRKKLDFGDDFGILNFAYALETLEAEFYEHVVRNPPADLRPGELQVLRDIGAHEKEHQRFFKRALNVLRIEIPPRDFSSIVMTRDGVLGAARMFEDLGVAGYNGAGSRVRLAEFLTIAGKIVSVEARHASAIRDLIDPNSRSFAGDDVIDAMGMDRALAPAAILDRAQPFFRGRLKVVNL